MLDVLNRYAHGFVVVPVVLACRRGGVLSALQSQPQSAEELAAKLRANLGHLQVSLRLLESLGWIDRRDDDRFVSTPALAKNALLADELWTLVTADMDAYLRRGSGTFLAPWIEKARKRWGIADPLIADFCDSLLVIPIMALLTKRKVLKELPASDFKALPEGVAAEVIEFLRILGWLEGSAGAYKLTPPGEFMFERAMNLGVCESYRPMLSRMDDLLFGDAEAVFALDSDGRETHVDRSMNVIASGFMHDRYFAEVEQILISIFSREPFSAQPRYVADMGSGDGTFLKRVYETVRDKTPRGKRLAEFPLTMIGIDLNKASLEETAATLRAAGIEHVTVTGDIGIPRKAIDALAALGVDPNEVLHIRSFLDHDRPYIPPADHDALAARSGARYLGAYVDRKGNGIPPAAAVQSLVEHLQRWSDVITEHGFILLEVHCQDPLVLRAYRDESESLYFDAIEGYSQQLLIEADAALMSAAEAGLFPRRDYFRKFPGFLPYCRITLNLFERRPYRVRLARQSDLPALLSLEAACWPEAMRVPAEELRRRIRSYALGQWVLEMDGRVVGVVYSQRIASVDQLRDCRFADVRSFFDPNGSVVQLLGLNVLPQMQHLGLGDQLLDLMLMRSALQGGVRQVAGLTRCKDFRGASLDDFRAYIARRDDAGRPIDPVLQFHHSHGAKFIGAVPEYRPADVENLGAGVLLCYDLGAPGTTLSTAGPEPAAAGERGDTKSRLEGALRSLLGPARQGAFGWRRSLRDMGLDSLNLLEFRTLLQQTFGVQLSPTFFFSHPTPADIETYFDSVPSAAAAADSPSAPARVDLSAQLEAAEQPAPARKAARSDREPLAVVGMACRFPGCDDVAAYWRLLAEGRDAITEIPRSRWDIADYYSADPDAPGKMASRFGGFVSHHDEFDAGFFGISPREAELMDPQQRLLLEVHWEALENAGIDPERLRDTASGFFVGLYSHDYELLQVAQGGEDLGAFYATGNSASIAAGRLAYFLGTRGPAMTIDTACSSSLVAVHQAMRSLRSGESDIALASGVSLLLSPRLSVAFSKAGMLAPDGRCKTFDAAANGYVRSEGCGVVVLKRLDDALRDGDEVLAILRGSAINQDGASNGLTAPSLPAQASLLRLALEDAGLQAADIDYVEAHGTGTSLGDPVEFEALNEVFGGDERRRAPLWLGSVKTNIGHTEAAAGIAGLIKVVLAMQAGRMPAHLHFKQPNAHIQLERLPARIPVHAVEWGDRGVLRAGVSAFGFSGTNSHVIVEQAPRAKPQANAAGATVFAVSAKSPGGLRAAIDRYAGWLETHSDVAAADACYRSCVGRTHHAHRIAVAARTSAGLARRMREALDNASIRAPSGEEPRIAFLFTGQGSQYPGMARELALAEPAFRRALAECRSILDGQLEAPLEELLYPAQGAPARLDQTVNTQPALFAVEYALASMLQSWGIRPAAVLGHSVGEYVAACLAGVFSLEDGLRLIAARGRLMQSLPPGGAMAAVLGPRDATLAALEGRSDVAVAAFNGPESLVVSGSSHGVEELRRQLERGGARVVPLAVSHAFHSMLMEPILPAFREITRWVRFAKPQLPFASNVTGALAGDEVAVPEYWVRHLREPVRFEQGMRALVAQGVDVMLEVGPHPVLSSMGRGCVDADAEQRISWVPLLTRDVAEWESVSAAMATLYERGAAIDWAKVYGAPRRAVALPNYPWQRKRYWFKRLPAKMSDERRGEGVADEPLYTVRHAPFARLDEPAFETDATFIPPVESLSAAAVGAARSAREAYGRPAIRQRLDAWCRDRIGAALRQLGWQPVVGETVSGKQLLSALQLRPRYERLLDRMLEILAEDGFAKAAGGGAYVVTSEPPRSGGSLEAIADAAPECGSELKLLERCAGDLARVLRGDTDPLDLIFPGGDMSDAEALYTRAPFARVGNRMAAAAVESIVAALPPQRTLRILEIGAGTGATTAELLAVLPGDTEYVFTDVSQAFLESARAAFGKYPFVRYELLNVELDPAAQGFAPGQFDIVVASNVLHATADLEQSLRHAAGMLAPGGTLLLVEGLERTRWIDLVFGLTEGWWRFTDPALRPAYPLLEAEQWRSTLLRCGLNGAAVVPALPPGRPPDSAADLFNQGLVIARAADGRVLPRPLAPTGRHYVVIADARGIAEKVEELVAAAGDSCVVVRANCNDRVSQLAGSSSPLTIVDLRAADLRAGPVSGEILLEQSTQASMAAVSLLRAAAALRSATVAFVTAGARAVRAGEVPVLGAAALAGLANVARSEHPALDVRSIDIDADADPATSAALLLRELRGASSDFRVAYRGTQRFVPTLAPAPRSGAVQIDEKGVYLVVGGLGELGLHTARWLAERGARRIVLAGRTAFPPPEAWPALRQDPELGSKVELLHAVQSSGATVRIERLDIRNRGEIGRMLERLEADGWGPLKGVVQATAVISAQLIGDITEAQFREVLAPKIAGTWNLFEELRSRPLDFFALYSSLGALVGLPGQASYAAANSFVDALATTARAAGMPATGLNWCGWRNTGVARTAAGQRSLAELELLGIDSVSPERATELLDAALAAGCAQVATVPLVAEARRAGALQGLDPLVARLRRSPAPSPKKAAPSAAPSRASALAALDGETRSARVQEIVLEAVAELLDLELAGLSLDASLGDLGMDSLLGLEFRKVLQGYCGLSLSPTLVWSYPTARAIATHICARIGGEPTVPAGGAGADTSAPRPSHSSALGDLERMSEEETLRQLTGR